MKYRTRAVGFSIIPKDEHVGISHMKEYYEKILVKHIKRRW